ncbi:MAG: hypothetical protein SHS37scaffold220_4 [Phage 67_12]|nr:MAG: hypothetical protein SHS37scaffold220_4 [Phage 67_12]
MSNRLTPAQVEILRRARDNGGVVADPVAHMNDVAMLGHFGFLTAAEPRGTKVLTQEGAQQLPRYE